MQTCCLAFLRYLPMPAHMQCNNTHALTCITSHFEARFLTLSFRTEYNYYPLRTLSAAFACNGIPRYLLGRVKGNSACDGNSLSSLYEHDKWVKGEALVWRKGGPHVLHVLRYSKSCRDSSHFAWTKPQHGSLHPCMQPREFSVIWCRHTHATTSLSCLIIRKVCLQCTAPLTETHR